MVVKSHENCYICKFLKKIAMKIFTNDVIRKIEELTVESQNISVIDLMERAASAITYEIMSRWRPSKRIVIYAGPGNNGGDAMAVARMLQEQGYRPEVYLFNINSANLSASCATNRDRFKTMADIDFTEITTRFTPPELGPDDVVIDGLFGSGLRQPLKGGYTSVVQLINDSGAFVVSIDIPSGLFSEWNMGTDKRNIIRANLTLALNFKRLAFFFAENAQFVGECKVLDLDLDANAIASNQAKFYLIERDDVKQQLKPRDNFSNKYNHGTIFLVAGSYGMMGAAILAARGALRAGAGLVSVHAPQTGCTAIQTAVPEALFDADQGELVSTRIIPNHKYSIVALGPGMRTEDETVAAIDSFMKNYRQPCVFDADALNCIASKPMLIHNIPKGSILTPHATEFDRLFGEHSCEEERLRKAMDVSQLYGINIVLKGHHTMIIRPDEKVYINSTGNAGMATAGTGDVLTGVIAAMIAQGYPADKAAMIAVYAHGLAGDFAAETHGQYGLIASDVAANIGRALKETTK